MKVFKIIKVICVGILFISIVGFVYLQQSTLVEQKKQLIIGTWVIDGEDTNKWIFTSNNICKWEYEGNIWREYTYSISSDFAPNGTEHPYVKLIEINNPNNIKEYTINSLGDTKMTLETTKPKVSYTYFTKQ